jgi:Protein of unknown function (DUF2752)
MKRLTFKYYFTVVKIGLIGLTPVLLLILPKRFFDEGRSVCLSKLLLNRECYACGMTKAIMHLIHLDIEEAYAYNMLSFVVLPLLCVVWVQWFLKECKMYSRVRGKMRATL